MRVSSQLLLLRVLGAIAPTRATRHRLERERRSSLQQCTDPILDRFCPVRLADKRIGGELSECGRSCVAHVLMAVEFVAF